MESTEVIFTLDDVLNAMEKNGYKQIQYSLYEYEDVGRTNTYHPDKKLIGGCAYGQAYANLGILPDTIKSIAVDIYDGEITDMNDVLGLSLPEIAKNVREMVSEQDRKRPWFTAERIK